MLLIDTQILPYKYKNEQATEMDLELLKQRAKAFDYLFDAIVVTNLQGIIIDWNKGSESLYGYSKVEALGQPVNILHIPEDCDHFTAEIISAVEKYGQWSGEVRILHKDGHIGWIESMCVPVVDNNEQMAGTLCINRDITARREETERLSNLAHFDQLTEIPNRYLLLDRLTHLIEQCHRNESSFAILYIDLDNFKSINDTKGHAFGDLVLRETSSRLKQAIRNSDTVGRIGGDEFVVLLEKVSGEDDISMIADILIEKLHDELILNGEKCNISGSIGIASYPEDGRTTDELLAAADKAMYKAKNSGRDNYKF